MPAQPSPGGNRSSRTRALELGTDPSGFIEGVSYDSQAGHPDQPGMPAQHYRGQEPMVGNSGQGPIQRVEPPFTLGNKG